MGGLPGSSDLETDPPPPKTGRGAYPPAPLPESEAMLPTVSCWYSVSAALPSPMPRKALAAMGCPIMSRDSTPAPAALRLMAGADC